MWRRVPVTSLTTSLANVGNYSVSVSYDFRTVDPARDPELADEWIRAVHQGFHDGHPSDEALKRYRETLIADGAVSLGVYRSDSAGPELSADYPVATYASLEGSITMPSLAQLPNHMITDVTVSPTHRRRGLLRRLITEDLAAAAKAGTPIATLTVSEATIYGRFGFGVITEYQEVEVDTSPGFAFLPEVKPDEGRVEMAEVKQLATTAGDVFDEFHRRTAGSVTRPAGYREYVTGEWDYNKAEAPKNLRAAIHRDATGVIDGYVVYSFEGWETKPARMKVRDLIGVTNEAYLALWSFLGSLDLIEQVRTDWPSDSDPLPWALADRRRYRVTKRDDSIWARVLDPIRCLENVGWQGFDRIVLDVTDPLGHAAGAFAVTVQDRAVRVERTADPGDIALNADALSTLIFGTVNPAILHKAGRLRGSVEDLERLSALAATTPSPQSLSRF